MGKLDYLSKYTKPPSHKEKKKKAKKRHRKDDEVRLNDEDDSFLVPGNEVEDDEDDEDRPTVVDSVIVEIADGIPSNERYGSQQEWKPVLVESQTRKRRYDSDDEEQPSPTLRPNEPSQQSRRKRFDSESDSAEPSEAKRSKRKRFHSDDDIAIKRERNDSDDDAPSRRGGRFDSDEDKGTGRKRFDSDDDVPSDRGARFDSDGDKGMTRNKRNDSDDDAPSRRGARFDSDDDKGTGRKRFDSDDDVPSDRGARFDSDDNKVVTRKRYDSDDDDVLPSRERRSDSHDDGPSRKKRYKAGSDNRSGESQNPGSKIKGDDSFDEGQRSKKSKERRAQMSSGHAAGLQKAGDFRDTEVQIQAKRRMEAQAMVDKHGMGETVYRNELGQKVDSAPAAKPTHLNEREEAELRKGRVQKEREANLRDQFRELQRSTFARHADDGALENLRKDVIRKGDPMASYAAKKKISEHIASGKPARPLYKGPPPKPNRFGILPGYRWDGVDRGNGFEDKALASKFSSNHKKEQAYRWSTSDM